MQIEVLDPYVRLWCVHVCSCVCVCVFIYFQVTLFAIHQGPTSLMQTAALQKTIGVKPHVSGQE